MRRSAAATASLQPAPGRRPQPSRGAEQQSHAPRGPFAAAMAARLRPAGPGLRLPSSRGLVACRAWRLRIRRRPPACRTRSAPRRRQASARPPQR